MRDELSNKNTKKTPAPQDIDKFTSMMDEKFFK